MQGIFPGQCGIYDESDICGRMERDAGRYTHWFESCLLDKLLLTAVLKSVRWLLKKKKKKQKQGNLSLSDQHSRSAQFVFLPPAPLCIFYKVIDQVWNEEGCD